AVAFSPDGTMLATLAADGTARIWNVATQQQAGPPVTVDGRGAAGGALGSGPEGKPLATAGAGGQVELWSVATRQRLGRPMAAGPGITMLAVRPRGGPPGPAARDGAVPLVE